MKRIMILVALLITSNGILNAQENYKHALQGLEWVKIESSADVIVKTHDKNELLIESKESHKMPERAKGLKLVGSQGVDNTDVGFYVIKEGNSLIVKNLKKSRKAKIYLPASQKISVTANWNGDIDMEGFKGEIEAISELNGGISLKDISGPLTANTLNGGINVLFSKVNQSSPITIYSTNGALDINLPQDTPANFNLGTTNGSIYTNFDIEVPEKNGLKAITTKKISGTVNNGGVNIKLKTINGSIYLRKQ